MNPVRYGIIVSIYGIYQVMLQIILLLMLWNVFVKEKRNKRMLAAGAILAAVNVLLALYPDTPFGFRYAVSAVLILGYCFLADKRHMEKVVFVLLLFYNFHSLSFLIANSFYQYITDICLRGLDAAEPDYLARMYARVLAGQAVMLIFYTIAFLLMTGIVKKTVKEISDMKWQDVIFLSVLNIAGIMLAGMIMELSFVQVEQEIFLLYDEKRQMLWKIPVMACLLCIGEVSAIYISREYARLQQERQKRFVEARQAEALRQRLSEAESLYSNIRRIRHEIKNHMTVMKGLAACERYEEVESYIGKLDESIEALDLKFHTGNAVTDVIINDKYRKASKDHISFRVNFTYTERDSIPVFDIGIILNNLLDNAIEGCERMPEKERFVALTLKRKAYFLLIEVENSFDGVLDWREGAPFPATSKKSGQEIPEEHGIGLYNVKEIAERYFGDMEIRINENRFKTTVMLQQKEEQV